MIESTNKLEDTELKVIVTHEYSEIIIIIFLQTLLATSVSKKAKKKKKKVGKSSAATDEAETGTNDD